MDKDTGAVRSMLAEAGFGDGIASVTALAGGAVNAVWQVGRADGSQFVIKATAAAPAGMFLAEADGLGVLRDQGGLRTPMVLAAGQRWLILQAMRPRPATPAFWETAGREIAALHAVPGMRFGWQHNGWLGLLAQHNDWCDDGHEFFATRRILRYLPEPKTEVVLDQATRTAIERLCARLPELVPPLPPVLTHGDLWPANVVATATGLPAFIDPAVSWTWSEVDLAMMYCAGGTPDRFFDAYQELQPLEAGWRDRMPILHLRELLSDAAHFGTRSTCLDSIDRITRPFRLSRGSAQAPAPDG